MPFFRQEQRLVEFPSRRRCALTRGSRPKRAHESAQPRTETVAHKASLHSHSNPQVPHDDRRWRPSRYSASVPVSLPPRQSTPASLRESHVGIVPGRCAAFAESSPCTCRSHAAIRRCRQERPAFRPLDGPPKPYSAPTARPLPDERTKAATQPSNPSRAANLALNAPNKKSVALQVTLNPSPRRSKTAYETFSMDSRFLRCEVIAPMRVLRPAPNLYNQSSLHE